MMTMPADHGQAREPPDDRSRVIVPPRRHRDRADRDEQATGRRVAARLGLPRMAQAKERSPGQDCGPPRVQCDGQGDQDRPTLDRVPALCSAGALESIGADQTIVAARATTSSARPVVNAGSLPRERR